MAPRNCAFDGGVDDGIEVELEVEYFLDIFWTDDRYLSANAHLVREQFVTLRIIILSLALVRNWKI